MSKLSYIKSIDQLAKEYVSVDQVGKDELVCVDKRGFKKTYRHVTMNGSEQGFYILTRYYRNQR